MKTLKILLLTTCLVGFSSVASLQLRAQSAIGDASIIIESAGVIEVTKESDLFFGTINPVSGSGGSVAINPQTGAVSTVSGNFILSGSPTVARFDVQGPAMTFGFSYSLPASLIIKNSQGNTMTINSIKVHIPPQTTQGNNTGSGQTNSQGNATIYVGGTLNINANQANGVYSNTSDLKLVIILQ